MFHIAIVDDDQSIHQKLEEMITSILFKYLYILQYLTSFLVMSFLLTKIHFLLLY